MCYFAFSGLFMWFMEHIFPGLRRHGQVICDWSDSSRHFSQLRTWHQHLQSDQDWSQESATRQQHATPADAEFGGPEHFWLWLWYCFPTVADAKGSPRIPQSCQSQTADIPDATTFAGEGKLHCASRQGWWVGFSTYQQSPDVEHCLYLPTYL